MEAWGNQSVLDAGTEEYHDQHPHRLTPLKIGQDVRIQDLRTKL